MKTMQKNRIVLGITAIVVIALLYVGAGYAFSGDARTYNPGDEQKLEYMSITPADFNPIFTTAITEGTIFDTYVYQGATVNDKETAYAFNVPAETVVDLTIDTVEYKAVKLGETKNMTVHNETGAAITALNVSMNTASAVGSADFVYIFKLQIGEATPAYIIFNGVSTGSVADFAASLPDAEHDVVIGVTAYIAYAPNVIVPTNYVGPVSTTMTDEGHKYIHPAAAPVNLAATSFGIQVSEYVAP